VVLATPVFAENLVLVNGTIIDGTLKARFQGNVRIRDGRIRDIGVFKPVAGETILDVKGFIVAPGFIDLHNQPASELAKDLGAVSQITQGITTAILGGDGTGPYSVEEFMLPFDEKPPALNIMTLVGHGTVRRQIMGTDYKRAATADEIRRMGELIDEAMRQGAYGLSSDLTAEPSSYSTSEELMVLGKAMARSGGVYITRARDDDKALESIRAAIEIGRTAKVSVQISPIKLGAALMEIDKARMQGADVAADTAALTTDKDLRAFLQHPWVMIASDGETGVFPTVLGKYVREQKLLTLERAIRKMTGLPASRAGLKTRGLLAKGATADVVVFDPLQATVVMKYVFVNGTIVVKDGQATGERPGLALR
jgi:N-acyl-D-aspartate/D-glutamate deacylase